MGLKCDVLKTELRHTPRFRYKILKRLLPIHLMSGENTGQDAGETDGISATFFYLDGISRRHALPHAVSRLELGLDSQARSPGETGVRGYVERFFSDRTKAEKSIVKQILNEIALRENLQTEDLSSIEKDILKCENWLHEISAVAEQQKYLSPDESVGFGSRRTSLEAKLLDLHELKRRTEVEAWKDLSTLRRYLLFAFRDYWVASRRSQLLHIEGPEDKDADSGL